MDFFNCERTRVPCSRLCNCPTMHVSDHPSNRSFSRGLRHWAVARAARAMESIRAEAGDWTLRPICFNLVLYLVS